MKFCGFIILITSLLNPDSWTVHVAIVSDFQIFHHCAIGQDWHFMAWLYTADYRKFIWISVFKSPWTSRDKFSWRKYFRVWIGVKWTKCPLDVMPLDRTPLLKAQITWVFDSAWYCSCFWAVLGFEQGLMISFVFDFTVRHVTCDVQCRI